MKVFAAASSTLQRLHRDDDLAPGSTLVDVFECVDDLAQREAPIDEGLHLAGGDQDLEGSTSSALNGFHHSIRPIRLENARETTGIRSSPWTSHRVDPPSAT